MHRIALANHRKPATRQVEVPPDAGRAELPSRFFRWSLWVSRPIAAVLLVPALPVMLVCMLVVRLTSPGPAIYRQVRVWRHGRHFTMYKLRTMRADAEKHGAVWARTHDDRVTPFGRFLRKSHLDELPQLFNVLKGEMALVGPRPERPEFVTRLVPQIPGYLDRLSVLPGVTGLAQVNLPPDTDLDSVRRKLVLDLEFIRTNSLSLELRLMLCTGLRIFKLPVIGLLGVGRTVRLPHEGQETEPPAPEPDGQDLSAQVLPHLTLSKSNGNHGSNGHAHRPLRAK